MAAAEVREITVGPSVGGALPTATALDFQIGTPDWVGYDVLGSVRGREHAVHQLRAPIAHGLNTGEWEPDLAR